MGSGNYSVEEVSALVEHYITVKERATPRRMWLFARVLDLGRAMRSAPLTRKQREAMLCVMAGLTDVEAGAALGVDERSVRRRYSNAIAALTTWLNGAEGGTT